MRGGSTLVGHWKFHYQRVASTSPEVHSGLLTGRIRMGDENSI